MNAAQIQFAQWLASEHPDIYAQIATKVDAGHQGLGDLTDFTPTLTDITFDPGTVDLSDSVTSVLDNIDLSALTSGIVDAANTISKPAAATSQGVLSSIGSGLASVGSYIVSPQGLNTLANVTKATLAVGTAIEVAHYQNQVIAAQAQRAANGQPPLPITYDENGYPVYYGSSGIPPGSHAVRLADGSIGYVLDSQGSLSSVLNFSSIPWYIWAAAGGLVLILATSRN
jgi:hypothetical protein